MKKKIITFLLITFISSLSAKEINLHEFRINLNVRNIHIKELLEEIEKQTDYLFVYNPNEINLNKETSLQVNNKPIVDVLTNLFDKTDIIYVIEGNSILLMKRPNIQQTERRTVSGTITDESGEPVPGTNIAVKGTTLGVISDVNGSYSITVPDGNAVLVFSFIGYAVQEVSVRNQNVINIVLGENARELDEIVVIGYGSVKKSDLTGSIANVSALNSNRGGSSTSVGQMIEGRVAGLTVQNTSSQPGGASSIIIRGRNSIYGSVDPLYIVDGFPYDAAGAPSSGEKFSNSTRDPLNFINPNDIENISVLKDAAATAIYGTRGANGVIVITTKKGRQGKPKITYDGYGGVQDQAKKYELLSGPEYMKYWSQFEQGPTFTEEEIANATTTNWVDEITQQGVVHSHQISLSAAEKYLRYYFSAGYYYQKGIIKNAEMQRMSARSNVDYIKDKLNINTNIAFTNINDLNQADDGSTRSSIIESALSFSPTLKKPDNGSYVVDVGSNFNIYPLSALGVEDKTKSDKLDLNINIDYEILPGLKPQVKLGYSIQNALRTYFMPSTTPYNGGVPNAEGQFHGSRASSTSTRNLNYTLEGLLNYNKKFLDDFKLIVLLGYSYQNQGWFGNRTKGQEFSPVDIFGPNNMGAAATQYAETWKGENIIISGFGRLDLTWQDKYFLTGTLRRDGASKFGENNKWGWFPGVSAAWKLNNENFLRDFTSLDLLKLRLGWGVTGNSGFDNFLSQPLYNVVLSSGAIIGQKLNPATMVSATLANQNLKWETTAQFNIGIDWSMFQRFNMSFDIYKKKTTDLIIPMPLPIESGLSEQWVNAADFKVTGIELSLDGKIIRTDKFNWSSNFTLGWNNNEVSKINVAGEAAKSSLESIGILVGEKPMSYFMYKFKEVDANGSLTFEDLDGNGSIDVKDRAVIGNADPNVTIGLGNTFNYKNFELSFFFNSALGQKIHNTIKADHTSAYLAHPKNMFRSVLTEANLPKYWVAVGGDFVSNSRWVEDASYLRLQNVILSYTIPTSLFKDKLDNFRLYVQGQNLFTISEYSGVNPEANSLYPAVRTITGGLSITF